MATKELREETFVVSGEHLEWTFDNETNEPTCHLILPRSKHESSSCSPAHKHCCTSSSCSSDGTYDKHGETQETLRTSNECAICMAEYDIGDAIVRSRNCGHAFHQSCILDWISRENTNCPSCRAVFYDPKGTTEGRMAKTPSATSSPPNRSMEGGVVFPRRVINYEGRDDVVDGFSEEENESGEGRRDRSDTADTDALTVMAERRRSEL